MEKLPIKGKSNTITTTEILGELATFKEGFLQELRQLLLDIKAPPTKQWLKTQEVLKLLNISPGTLQTLRNKNIIPFTKIGGVLYYSKGELDKIMSSKQFPNF